LGGFFAMAFATLHPDRVRRLVLVGAPAGLDREIPLFPRLWGNPIIGSLIGKLVAKTKSPEAMRARVFPLLVAHPENLPLEFLEIALAAQKLPGAGVAAHTMLRSVLTMRGWRRQLMMRDDLAKLSAPTLFVWGAKDAFAPPSSGQNMVARMANANIEIIEDAGHLPFLDQPDAIAAVINPFLQTTNANSIG
ncbi:MAG: alpha/beta fold hydrolase, partial [Proteobacteria bacterium]|nr:alpha/beta fold hydrolase [Pseudomonadota bacterium]